MKTKKRIPKFKTEEEERNFWEKHDSVGYINYSKAKRGLFSKLKPSTETISIRMPEGLLDSLKLIAHKNDIPYQSLMKIFLSERINEELTSRKG
jgi:predicted DNA binding CopG/RHH family protein